MLVTLCGSTRFESEFIAAGRELSRRGVTVFSLAVLPCHRGTDEGWSDGQLDKTMADLLYYDRIERSDAVIVLGDGYIGTSTAREILWAQIRGKGIVRHLVGDAWDETLRRLRSGRWDLYIVQEARKVFGDG